MSKNTRSLADELYTKYHFHAQTDEYKGALKKSNLEQQTTQIAHYTLPDTFSLEKTDIIDSLIYKEIRSILKRYGLKEGHESIASIIKQFYSRKILYEVNKKNRRDIVHYHEELSALFNLMVKGLAQITVRTNKKKEVYKIENPEILNAISKAIKKNVLNQYGIIDIVTSAEFKRHTNKAALEAIIDEAAFQVFLFIQTQTDFNKNNKEANVKNQTYSNNLCNLIFDLLDAGGVFHDKPLKSPDGYIRQRIKRYLGGDKELFRYFETPSSDFWKEFSRYFRLDKEYVAAFQKNKLTLQNLYR